MLNYWDPENTSCDMQHSTATFTITRRHCCVQLKCFVAMKLWRRSLLSSLRV